MEASLGALDAVALEETTRSQRWLARVAAGQWHLGTGGLKLKDCRSIAI
jgi:hypothetical protein